jgi:uncharacterized protein YcbK (DUF882 family)
MALKYFKINEFDSPDLPGSGRNMDSDFLEMLDVARGAAGVSFKINSGYRTQAHHESIYKRLGKKPTRSAHLTGNAADIACNSSRERYKILSALLEAGFTRFGVSDSFIHVDNANDKSQHVIWTY